MTQETLWPPEICLKEMYKIMKRIPEMIIDIHTHRGLRSHFKGTLKSLPRAIGTSFLWADEEYYNNANRWWNNKKIIQVAFPFVTPGIDTTETNQYIVDLSKHSSGKIIPFLGVNLVEKYRRTLARQAASGMFRGIKLHPLSNPGTMKSELFSSDILSLISTVNGPVLIHAPRLLNTSNIQEVLNYADKISPLPLIIAHCGNIRNSHQLQKEILKLLQNKETVYFETSTVIDPSVIQLYLDALGPKRILFGTDQPFNAMRAKYIQTKNGLKILTQKRYSWLDKDDWNLSIDRDTFKSIHMQNIEAVLSALNNYSKIDIENYFFRNALRILSTKKQ